VSGADTQYGEHAEAQADARTLDLQIAAQPLDRALQEFSRQSGMQVIFFSSLTDGIRSPGVAGRYTVAEALKELLAGSGLTFRLINPTTVEIRKANTTQDAHVEGGE
jgi:Secretin and TonB N terminus short domain